MGYKVISSKHEDKCSCFKCASKNIERDFKEKSEVLFKYIGFIPREFDVEIIKKRKGVDVATPQFLMSMTSKIEDVNKNNSQFKSMWKIPPVYCFDCGKLHAKSKNRMLKYQNKKVYVCSQCFKEKYFQCKICKCIDEQNKGIKISREVFVCKDCFKTHYGSCDHCHSNFLKAHLQEVVYGAAMQKRKLCSFCVTKLATCSVCNVLELKGNMSVVYGELVCHQCKEEAVPIKQYMYKPKPIWQLIKNQTFKNDMLMFGVEWELENNGKERNDKIIEKLIEIMGRRTLYCKKDSTINNGFEVVTHPFSWENYLSNREKWDDAINTMYTLGMRNKALNENWESTCGIHIHMSKEAFTTAHLYKFFNFIYTKPHRKFIIDVSQRGKENPFATFYDSDAKQAKACARLKTNVSGEHHSAVELLHPNTVEIRIFNSTTDRIDFHKNIEFCHSLYSFSKNASISEVKLSNYLEYVIKNKPKTYKNLYTFLRDRMNCAGYTPLKFNFSK